MKRRTTFLVVTLLLVAVGLTSCAGTRTLTEQVPAEAKHTALSAREAHVSPGVTISWDGYEEIIGDPDNWSLRVEYQLWLNQRQVGFQSLVTDVALSVDESGEGDFVIDEVPAWTDLEFGASYDVRVRLRWTDGIDDLIVPPPEGKEADANGYWPLETFYVAQLYEDCPPDPPTLTPWISPTLTLQPTLTPRPTSTCRWTATAEATKPPPTPRSTAPPLPTATEYPTQPP